MKNICTLIIFSSFIALHAQDEKLFNFQWKLEQIVTNTQTFTAVPYPPYADDGVEEQIYFENYNPYYGFSFGYYGNGTAYDLIFDDTNFIFTISDFSNHLGGMSPAESFFSEEFIYDDPYQMTIQNPFNYDFRYENDLIYLDITNNQGSVATFYDNFLNLQEFTKHSILIYPNPSSDFINIEIENQELLKVLIFDMTGKLVLEKKLFENKEIDTSDLLKGIYIIKIQTTSGLFQEKLIKK